MNSPRRVTRKLDVYYIDEIMELIKNIKLIQNIINSRYSVIKTSNKHLTKVNNLPKSLYCITKIGQIGSKMIN